MMIKKKWGLIEPPARDDRVNRDCQFATKDNTSRILIFFSKQGFFFFFFIRPGEGPKSPPLYQIVFSVLEVPPLKTTARDDTSFLCNYSRYKSKKFSRGSSVFFICTFVGLLMLFVDRQGPLGLVPPIPR